MYTIEFGLAAIAIATLSLLSLPLYTHLRSPITHTIRPPPDNTIGGLAPRLVLLVADGLSFSAAHSSVPLQHFLKQQNVRAMHGESWVDAPTESRPAHGQLLCGVDEDPRGIYERWQRYLRKPDSVLNRAPFAVAIGAPDVVPFFTGRSNYVETFVQAMYQQDGVHLDEWVRNKVNDLLSHAKENETFGRRFKSVGTIIFLHLAGIDTTGHRYGSASPQYGETVDKMAHIVSDIHQIIQNFYQDNETVYMLTSDHGFDSGRMHDEATLTARKTPLFIWGKGFSGQTTDTVSTRHKDLSLFISSVVGNQLPTDSTGSIPIHLFRNSSDLFKAGSLLLSCHASLNRMHSIYHQCIEQNNDRLLAASSTLKDIEAMRRSFDQLQIVLENKPALAADIAKMARAAHSDILLKSEALLWRNSAIGVALGLCVCLLSSVALYSLGFSEGKGSGDSGAYSYTALGIALICTIGLIGRGTEWPYIVWCWGIALVFAVNGPVMLPKQIPDPLTALFLTITVLGFTNSII